jgi:histidine triad (HIT) family protein
VKKISTNYSLQTTNSEKQLLYKSARAKDWYDDIWKTVGKCVFCDLREKYILFEENGIVMTISLYAYIDGHFMIIPRRHVQSPKELTESEWETIRKFTYLAKKLIKKSHKIDSMQIVYKDGVNAQSTVGHLHLHCIPFDAPDLAKWNYRDLEFTPLENVAKYKSERKDFFKNKAKFEEKYSNKSTLPIVCDLIIKNKKREILFQERKEQYKFSPDIITLPGGHIEDFNSSIETELAREVKEEISIQVNESKIKLIASGISKLNKIKISEHLKVKYKIQKQFLWNTYIYGESIDETTVEAGDDCEKVVWLSVDEVFKSERVSEELKERIYLI